MTTLVTVPPGQKFFLKSIVIANPTAGTLTGSVHLRGVGEVAGPNNIFFPDIDMPARSSLHWTGFQVLEEGFIIEGLGSSSLNIVIAGAVQFL